MKILVVDDEPAVRDMISDALRLQGNEVVGAANGEEALARFIEGGVDMITLDQKMPGLSGAELHHLLTEEFGAGRRTSGFAPRRPPAILIITGAPEEAEIVRTQFGEGVVGVLPKPVDIRLLLQIAEETAAEHAV